MTSHWNPDFVEHASRRYTTFRFVVYFIQNRDKAKASKNRNITFENTLASLVLKRFNAHFILTGGHQSKIVDNRINGSEIIACSLISSQHCAVVMGLQH